MHPRFWTSLAVATVFATLGASAQTGQSTSSPTTQTPSQRAANQVTVTGCIQPSMPAGVSGATGTSGTSGASMAGEVAFTLTHAMPASTSSSSSASSEPASRPEMPTGTSGSSSASSGVTYRLKADSTQLSKHVGHKVEITGTLDESAHPSGSAISGGGTTSAAPELKVEQIKMIAASCS